MIINNKLSTKVIDPLASHNTYYEREKFRFTKTKQLMERMPLNLKLYLLLHFMTSKIIIKEWYKLTVNLH